MAPPLSYRLTRIGLALCAALHLAACAGTSNADPASPEGSAHEEPAIQPCPLGEVQGVGGRCFSVGPQGCLPQFINAAGRCQPQPSDCPAGAVPVQTEGCIPVGPPECAAAGPSGLCLDDRPTCLGDSMAGLDGICVPVGVADCAAAQRDAQGSCHPSVEACPPGDVVTPQGCFPLGGDAACGASPWGPLPTPPGTVFVDAAAAAGGDGTADHPLHTLADGLAATPPGGTLAVAAGSYLGPVVIDQSITIQGRCAAAVHLDGGLTTPFVVSITTGLVTLRGVSIAGGYVGISAQGGDATVVLDRIHVGRTIENAIVAAGANVSLTVRRSRIDAEGGPGISAGEVGGGILVDGSATLAADSITVAGRGRWGIRTGGPGALSVVNSWIVGTDANGDQTFGAGLLVTAGGHATVAGSVFATGIGVGVHVQGPGADVRMARSAIIETRPRWGPPTMGLRVTHGAAVTLSGVTLRDNYGAAATAYDPETTLRLDGSLAVGGKEIPGMAVGPTILAKDGATVLLEQSAVTDSPVFGVVSAGAGTHVRLSRSVVERTSAVEMTVAGQSGAFCGGLMAASGALEVESSAILSSERCAIALGSDANGGPATLLLQRSVVALTRAALTPPTLGSNSAPDQRADGVGISAIDADITIRDSALVRNAGVSILAQGGALVVGRSLFAPGGCSSSPNVFGGGVYLHEVAAQIEDSAFLGSCDVAVVLNGGTTEQARNLIADTAGIAIVVGGGGHLTAHDEVLTGNTTGIAVLDSQLEGQGLLIAQTHGQDGALGFGISVSQLDAPASATLTASAIIASRTAGVAVRGGAFVGHNLLIAGREGPAPPFLEPAQMGSGPRGGGLVIEAGGRLELTGSRVTQSRVAGLLLVGAAGAVVAETRIDATTAGYATTAAGEQLEVIGDGIIARDSQDLSLRALEIEGCARAGIVFESSSGILSGSSVTHNTFGISVQGAPTPAIAADNQLTPNAKLQVPGPLATPDKPLEMPPPP